MSRLLRVPFVLVLALPLALAGCSSDDGGDGVCEVEDLIARDLAEADAVDCGLINIEDDIGSPSDARLEDAHACVKEALDADEAFFAVWSFPGFEGRITSGWVGGGGVGIVLYSRAPNPQGELGTGKMTCSGLVPLDFCDGSYLRASLCFDCIDAAGSGVCAP